MALFTPEQLKTWLRYESEDDFDTAAATLAETVVAGWLTDATKHTPTELATAATTTAPQVFSWAIELGGIAYENPTSMQDDQAGATRTTWRDRRSQILAAAKTWGEETASATSTTGLPRGCFPPARPWPDPPRVRGMGY